MAEAEKIFASDISACDTIVAVLGRTGSGKTTFIDWAVGQEGKNAEHDLAPGLPNITAIRHQHPTTLRPYVLVDAPGVDHEGVSGEGITTKLTNWLDSTGSNRIRLSGIIYLHPITDIRADKTSLNNLLRCTELCGGDVLERVVLATTMWTEIDGEEGKIKEMALGTNWPRLLAKSPAMRFENTSTSAWAIIDRAVAATAHIGTIQPTLVVPNDTIVALMGPTGTGKSTFIETATSKQSRTVGHNLKSCTSEIRAVRHHHPESRKPYVLVDTPGFDHTEASDDIILARIGDWLRKTYNHKVKLSGIIYFHRISDNRMAASPLRNLTMFTRLCGDKAISHVVLMTTMWRDILLEVGEGREEELKCQYWRATIKIGSKVVRFGDTAESAWNVIDIAVAGRVTDPQALLLQEELVDFHLRLSETEVGKALYDSLRHLLEEQKSEIRRMREKVLENDDDGLVNQQRVKCEDLEGNLQNTIHQLAKMKIPLGRRIKLLFSFKRPQSRPLNVPPNDYKK